MAFFEEVIEDEFLVRGDPDEVFAVSWNPAYASQIDASIRSAEVVGGGPVEVGATLRYVVSYKGRSYRTEAKVEVFDPERGRVVTESLVGFGLRIESVAEYLPGEEGTRVRYRYRITPRHALGYLGYLLTWPGRKARILAQVDVQRAGLNAFFARQAAEEGGSLRVAPLAGSGRCPFCHDAVPDAEAVSCAGCHGAHHRACWDEHGQCAACGSRRRFGTLEETEGRPGPPAPGHKA